VGKSRDIVEYLETLIFSTARTIEGSELHREGCSRAALLVPMPFMAMGT
jgi:hypothetical protein